MTQALHLPGRDHTPEAMDLEAVPHEDLAHAHRDLDWLTALCMAQRPTLRWLDRMAEGRPALSILDVGCGSGDMLRRIARWGQAQGLLLQLDGVDLNPEATRVARDATDPALGIRFQTADAFALGTQMRPDIIISAHFAHHLSDDGLVAFVRWMEDTAQLGWFINDLHRHWLPLHGLRIGTRVVPFHRFVVNDAPISVRRGFKRRDWEAVIAAAGIPRDRVAVQWHFPFRWGVGTDAPG